MTSRRKKSVLKSETLSLFQNSRVNSLTFTFFFHSRPVQIKCPSLYINQALLLNSFFKIFKSLFLAARLHDYRILIRSLPIHFLISGYLLRTPKRFELLAVNCTSLRSYLLRKKNYHWQRGNNQLFKSA